MCEILIRLKDRSDKAQDYKAGDIVIIMPDGHTWGRMESKETFLKTGGKPEDWPDIFAIIKIPGMGVEEIKLLHEAGRTAVNGDLVKRSGVRLKSNPKGRWNDLRDKGQLSINKLDLIGLING